MKKRLISMLAIYVVLVFGLPLRVSAADGYVASKNSEVFHEPNCSYVDRIANYNLISFETLEDALGSGRRGCSRCNPELGSYTRDSSKSSDDNFDASSYTDGFFYGKEYGYDLGYNEGYEEGETDGYSSGYEEGYAAGKQDVESSMESEIKTKVAKARKDAILGTLGVLLAFSGPILIVFESLSDWISSKTKKNSK